jgi:hypothetical protein
LVLGTWYLVLGTWYLVLGTWYLVLGTWYLVLGTWAIAKIISKSIKQIEKQNFFFKNKHET